MAANEERPLEIKQFPGIDRFDRGTVTPPNYFETLQNYHPKSLGELQSLSGVEDISAADLPGVDKIIKTAIHKDFGGRELLLAFFKPDINASTDFGQSLIDSSLFSATGGTSQTQNYYVCLYGPGGVYKTIKVYGVTLDSNGGVTTFTTPAGLPSWVCQINIFQIGTGTLNTSDTYNGALVASLTRRAGAFPASVSFRNRSNSNSTPPTGTRLNQLTPVHMSVSFGTSGSLQAGKTYHTGIASNVAPNSSFPFSLSYPRTRLQTEDGESLSFVLPNGFNSAQARYFFANTETSTAADQSLRPGGTEALRAWFFLGTTPEDVLVSGPTPGAYSCIERDVNVFVWDNLISPAVVSAVDDTITSTLLSGLFFDERPVIYNASGAGTPGGLVNNTVYWLKYVGLDSVKLATSLNNLRQGIFVDITSAGTEAGKVFSQIVFSVNYTHVPYNSNNGVTMAADYPNLPREVGGTNQEGDSNRRDGVFINSQFWPEITTSSSIGRYRSGRDFFSYPLVGDTNNVGCWVLPDKVFNANAYQLLANINEKNFSITGSGVDITSPPIGPSLFWIPVDEYISAKQSTIRTYLANGDNTIFYTNGYVLKPSIRSTGRVRIPTSKYLFAFNSRIIAGGGQDSWQNSRNQVYYSEPDLPFDWGTSAPNTFNVFTSQDINGFGGYSQNLTTDGFQQYLLISKKDGLFSWNGDTSIGPQQLYYGFGLASPDAFIETDFGPIVVSRQNVYSLMGGNLTDIGDAIEPILTSLSDVQLQKIVSVYHNKIVKIGYPSADDQPLNRELWLELRRERGQQQAYFSGPHILTPYVSQAASIIYGDDRDLRFSANGKRLYLRDAGPNNNGVDIVNRIEISRLTMEVTQLWKLITRLDMATLVTADMTFNITFQFEDGTTQYVGTLQALLANTRQLNQLLLRTRNFGRVVKLIIESTSSNPHSIFNITIWHEIFKRRVLRY
jgi:hypothetical protein